MRVSSSLRRCRTILTSPCERDEWSREKGRERERREEGRGEREDSMGGKGTYNKGIYDWVSIQVEFNDNLNCFLIVLPCLVIPLRNQRSPSCEKVEKKRGE